MNKIKYTIFLSVVMMYTFATPIVNAQSPTEEIQPTRARIRNEMREEKNKQQEQLQEARQTQKDNRAATGKPMQGFLSKFVRFFDATIISISGDQLSALTIKIKTTDGKEVEVKTDGKTQFRRKFWGKIESVSEFSVGDTLVIMGKWQDDTRTSVQARFIRDISIQLRSGVFIGTVTTKTTDGFVIQTVNRGSQTGKVSSTTRFLNRKGETISQSDIVQGHKIRVRGLWNIETNTISQIKEVKDFSLPIVQGQPVVPTGTIVPTATVAPAQ